jgi:hypothetical protein
MADLYINFTVEHNKLSFLQNIFIGDYGKYNSPLLPIYIISGPELSVDGYIGKKAHSNFLVVESCKDSDQGYREIAFILMRYQSDDEIYVAFKGLWEGENRWDQIEKLVKSILCFVYDRGYTILSVFPFNLIPLEMYFPKEKPRIIENSPDKIPPPKGILGTEKESDQSDVKGSVSSKPMIYVGKDLGTDFSDILNMKFADPSGNIPKYGTFHELTGNQVKAIVNRCRLELERESTISWYYDHLPDYIQTKFTISALKKWLNNPKFKTK